MQNTFLSGLDWRYAVKSFDPSKKVSDQDIQKIKDAIRLAPTSYGLQPFRVVIVQDRDIKNKLKSSSFNQPQVDSSSHIFIFVAKLNVQKRIGEYCDLAGFKSQGMFKRAGVEAVMRGALLIKNAEEKLRWATDQTYIALAFGLAACAELRIDSCPMEGFSSSGFAEILGLQDGEVACVMMPVGYRSEEAKYEKTRFDEVQIFENK